jgi:p21-activated kinase 1
LDFYSKCLEKESEKRPSAAELLDHPFLSLACSAEEFAPIIDEARQGANSEPGLDLLNNHMRDHVVFVWLI